jgi:hypothetical protein
VPKAEDGQYICDEKGCGEKFKRVGPTRYCPEHRGRNSPRAIALRNYLAVVRYHKDVKKSRAKANALYAKTKDDPEKRARIRARDKARYAKDPQKFRDKTKAYRAKNPEKIAKSRSEWDKKHRAQINAHVKEVYHRDLEKSRAHARANQAKVKAKHPRRYRNLAKARMKRHDEKVRRERGW